MKKLSFVATMVVRLTANGRPSPGPAPQNTHTHTHIHRQTKASYLSGCPSENALLF